jgi:hypothetical protein
MKSNRAELFSGVWKWFVFMVVSWEGSIVTRRFFGPLPGLPAGPIRGLTHGDTFRVPNPTFGSQIE